MSIPSQSPFRDTLKERREMLSEHFARAIEPLLENESYGEISVERVIKAGGISRTTFYVYFTDKADLLLAMSDTVVSDLGRVAFWRLPDDATKDDLYEALGTIASVYRKHRLMLRALVEGATYDAALRAAHDAIVDRGIANVTAHIVAGQRSGTVAPELDPDGTARLLVTLGERALYREVGVGNAEDDEALLRPLADIFWRTLYAGYR